MICIITTPPDLGRYMEAANLLKVHKADTLCHISWADFSGLKPDETLYIIVHGDLNSVELSPGKAIDAAALAKLLVSHGLKTGVKFKKIKLLSCQGGKTKTGHTPFCQQLADALTGNGGPAVPVVGYDGETTVTDESGKSWAKDIPQSAYPTYPAFEVKLLPKYRSLTKHAESLPYTSDVEMKSNASVLAGLKDVDDVFQWLYAENDKVVKRLPTGQKDPMAKTYGAPGKTTALQWKTKK